ncbi:MAG: PIN domain-containing protein [Oscillospiraceae bacterium]|nr:PIN domain-containing protein [Oscillospiraceae bacterium]
MKIMIDTNVILDVLILRQPFYEDSRKTLEMCEKKIVQGFITASSVTDIFYLVRKTLHNTEEAYRCLGALLDILKILPVTNENVISAFTVKANDFEDCLLAVCAKANDCTHIVTRNKKDFKGFGISVLSPYEAISIFQN